MACPSTTPRARLGEDFARLAGFAGAVLGWSAARFWEATPVELAGVVAALGGDAAVPADADTIARLKEVHPDG